MIIEYFQFLTSNLIRNYSSKNLHFEVKYKDKNLKCYFTYDGGNDVDTIFQITDTVTPRSICFYCDEYDTECSISNHFYRSLLDDDKPIKFDKSIILTKEELDETVIILTHGRELSDEHIIEKYGFSINELNDCFYKLYEVLTGSKL